MEITHFLGIVGCLPYSPGNSPILSLNLEKSFRQDCYYQLYKLSDPFMMFSCELLIKCMQKGTEIPVTELKCPGCPAKPVP